MKRTRKTEVDTNDEELQAYIRYANERGPKPEPKRPAQTEYFGLVDGEEENSSEHSDGTQERAMSKEEIQEGKNECCLKEKN